MSRGPLEPGTGPGGPDPRHRRGLRPGQGPAEGPAPVDRLGLWGGFGVEIELMIVDAETLDVRPVADRLFSLVTGSPAGSLAATVRSEPLVEGIGWSNELALHVLELKTPGPVPTLEGLEERFQRSVRVANELLATLGCRLLPGGAHPWMDPDDELRLWPHEYTEVYHAFDRIFTCRGHGWANIQSTHLNLPFRDDQELALLHEAVRLVLPLIPALSAGTPILDGRVGPSLDGRLVAYRRNARRVPSVTGRLVPEPVRSEDEYRSEILERIYRDMAPLDPAGVLRHEWVNARGAIARFDRGAVEIRVVDAQECPRMDLAVLEAVAGAVRLAVTALRSGPPGAEPTSTDLLARLLDRTATAGRAAALEADEARLYERLFELDGPSRSVGAVWEALLDQGALEGVLEEGPPAAGRPAGRRSAIETVLERGCLAERILADLGLEWPGAVGAEPARRELRDTWARLADHLARGEAFLP